jgi:hypothetical protein
MVHLEPSVCAFQGDSAVELREWNQGNFLKLEDVEEGRAEPAGMGF